MTDRTPAAGGPVFETRRSDGVLQLARPETTFLSTGFDGGRARADAAYLCTVPEGFDRTDLAAYHRERLAAAGFDAAGPALLTGVDVGCARGARSGPVEVVATAGVSNPAALPVDGEGVVGGGPPTGGTGRMPPNGHAPTDDSVPTDDSAPADDLAPTDDSAAADDSAPPDNTAPPDDPAPPGHGTVNVVVGTDRGLAPGALANLVAVVAEAKAATLLAATGFPGTTSDAVVAACDPEGEPAAFSGSATAVGAAARACVREAVAASLQARYEGTDATVSDSVADAEHGVVTDRRAEVFEP